MLWGLLALMTACLFAGAAVYVSVAEHPARMGLEPGPALAQWKPAYQRGTAMQGSLAIVCFALGVAACLTQGGVAWIVGAVLMLGNWPWTLFVIMPVNKQLTATDPATAGPETRALLDKWAALHKVRVALGVGSALVFLAAALS